MHSAASSLALISYTINRSMAAHILAAACNPPSSCRPCRPPRQALKAEKVHRQDADHCNIKQPTSLKRSLSCPVLMVMAAETYQPAAKYKALSGKLSPCPTLSKPLWILWGPLKEQASVRADAFQQFRSGPACKPAV